MCDNNLRDVTVSFCRGTRLKCWRPIVCYSSRSRAAAAVYWLNPWKRDIAGRRAMFTNNRSAKDVQLNNDGSQIMPVWFLTNTFFCFFISLFWKSEDKQTTGEGLLELYLNRFAIKLITWAIYSLNDKILCEKPVLNSENALKLTQNNNKLIKKNLSRTGNRTGEPSFKRKVRPWAFRAGPETRVLPQPSHKVGKARNSSLVTGARWLIVTCYSS